MSLPGRLHFVSPNQVNVQIPWEFQGQPSVQMKVSVGLISSDVYTIPLATYSPGIFEFNDSGHQSAAVLDTNFAVVTQANPAKRGQAIQIYVNGLGPVDNQPPSGEPTAAQPFATTRVTPSVSIGGSPAQVLFSALAPGIVGLYQVNVIVPPGAPTGLQQLVVSIGGVDSKTSSLPVQ
jgi:uncharacterized protein (TIGR03437 family)